MALVTLALEVISRYRARRTGAACSTIDDLIARTRDLLRNVDARWVHYKLDLGIDHLLIDEAQDTSPEQWDIVKAFVAEFTAGAGARSEIKRTIFAVGDDKQSIFSFQGAKPLSSTRRRNFSNERIKTPDWTSSPSNPSTPSGPFRWCSRPSTRCSSSRPRTGV